MKTNFLDDIFVRHVLLCINERKLTIEEIHKRYLQKYPPPFDFIKKFLPPVSIGKVKGAVKILLDEGYITKEIVRFTDQVLEKDTPVYFLSQSGTIALLKKKQKNSF
ncbi:MAG: hypothetical protein WCT07_00270 [Candidatus Paceibacterota bacterium]|jgi:hypothetical protein